MRTQFRNCELWPCALIRICTIWMKFIIILCQSFQPWVMSKFELPYERRVLPYLLQPPASSGGEFWLTGSDGSCTVHPDLVASLFTVVQTTNSLTTWMKTNISVVEREILLTVVEEVLPKSNTELLVMEKRLNLVVSDGFLSSFHLKPPIYKSKIHILQKKINSDTISWSQELLKHFGQSQGGLPPPTQLTNTKIQMSQTSRLSRAIN